MICAACSSEMSTSTRFCPQCGNPALAGGSFAGEPTSATVQAGGSASTTQVLDLPPVTDDGLATSAPPAGAGTSERTHRAKPAVSPGDRVAGAVAPVRRWLSDSGLEIQLAIGGTALVLLAFFLFPYADVTAAQQGGRVWWRPILAVTATVLLVLALRRAIPAAGAQARIVCALALAAAGSAEAGLLGLVTANHRGLRAGFYLILLGMVVVLAATFLATRHPVRRLDATD